MNYQTAFLLILFISPIQLVSAKSEKEMYIESASQFQQWCKKQSYRHFRQKRQQPYNWVASTIRRLNDYETSGSWKVNKVEVGVFCLIRIGNKAKYSKIEIH